MSDLESRLAEFLSTLPGVDWPTATLVSRALPNDARGAVLSHVRTSQLVRELVSATSPHSEPLHAAFARITKLEAFDIGPVEAQIQTVLNLYEGLSDAVARIRADLAAKGGKRG